jgi:2-polyprenyl-6-methoxyphenol hydroxylase-like FAD-dependent oxidoreductase
LLARKGYRVLVVDRAVFPSDTISTHQVQLPGIARLKRWGLLDKVIASNSPAISHVHFDAGFVAFDGNFPEFEGVKAIFGPRRTHLDMILVDAAREAGVEVRENYLVDEVLFTDGKVSGIRGSAKGGSETIELATIIVGADGKHSRLAKAVNAPIYNQKPVLTAGYYTYFSGIDLQGGEIYNPERRAIGAWPTNDGLTMIFVSLPIGEFHNFRMDVEGNYMGAIDLAPDLADRVHSGRREERVYGTADMPNFYRKPFGPGWALVGDAGYVKDPITAQGISDAFRDAELLAEAIDAGLSGRQALEAALAQYENQRNVASREMYEFTAQLASFAPPAIEQRVLFSALPGKPEMVSQFLGVLTGALPFHEFIKPANMMHTVGLPGMVKIIAARLHNRNNLSTNPELSAHP